MYRSNEYIDYDTLMKDETELNNMFVLKYIKDIKSITNPVISLKHENVIPEPTNKDSNYFNFYICAYKYNETNNLKDRNQDNTLLGKIISLKTSSLYTHVSISIDKYFEACLGLRINGLFKEHPDYFRGIEGSLTKGKKYPYDVFRYKLNKQEYKRGIHLFNSTIFNQHKIKYETSGLLSCLFDKLTMNGVPYSKSKSLDDVPEMITRNSFICSSFGTTMLMNCISPNQQEAMKKLFGDNYEGVILERINPGALTKLKGVEFLFSVDGDSTIHKEVDVYEKKRGVMPN